MNTRATTSDEDENESFMPVDTVVGRATRVFRAGFSGSLALLIVGMVLIVTRKQSLPSHLVPLDEIVPGLIEGSAAPFVTLGILTMILTPVISTVTICLTFLQQGDRRYARLSAVVVLILILSISLSLR